MLASIQRIVRAEGQASGSPQDPDFETVGSFPLTVNDPATTDRAAAAFAAHFGDHALEIDRQTVSEDFSNIPNAADVPYTYWGIGFTDEKTYRAAEKAGRLQDLPTNHSPKFLPPLQPTLRTIEPGMRALKHSITPLGAAVTGSLAVAVGTICLDAVQYLKYRRTGGRETPLEWEFAPVDNWEKAPDPGQVGKRLIEGFTQRELSDRWAWPVSTIMHWSYGSAWGAFYGVLAGSLRRPHALYGLPFGAAVWVSGYLILPEGGLYKPIWEYDAKTRATDLSAHLAYGAGTGVAFSLLVKIL